MACPQTADYLLFNSRVFMKVCTSAATPLWFELDLVSADLTFDPKLSERYGAARRRRVPGVPDVTLKVEHNSRSTANFSKSPYFLKEGAQVEVYVQLTPADPDDTRHFIEGIVGTITEKVHAGEGTKTESFDVMLSGNYYKPGEAGGVLYAVVNAADAPPVFIPAGGANV